MASQPEWRLLDSGASDGFTNMAVDEAILLGVQQGQVPPTLRLYAWQPACLSIGTFQSANDDVDLDACAQGGIDWVRRPTGGRAILHDQEVTYSVAARQDNDRVAGDVMESYRRISLGLLHGLRLLGIDATLAPPASPAQSHGIPKPAACFAAPSPHEIMVNGRKIIGSAQRRQANALLQHGSLLLDLGVDKLIALLRFTSEEERHAMTARVRQESVTLRSLLGRAVDYAEVTQALVAGFSSGLDIALTPGMLSAREEEEAARLRRDKYTADAWRFRK